MNYFSTSAIMAIAATLSFSTVSPFLLQADAKSVAKSAPKATLESMDLTPYLADYAELVYRNYADAHVQAAAMQSVIELFLNNPNESTHAAAKAAWVKARQSYLQTEAFRFYEGPIDFIDPVTGEEGPEGRINAWPMNEAFIDYVQGKADSGVINDASFEISLANILDNDQVSDEADVTTGWHAIEFLLWGQDLSDVGAGDRPFTDFVVGQNNNDRRRAYLTLVTDQLVSDLMFLESEWQPGRNNYRAAFLKADQQKMVGKIFTSLATLSAFEMSSERMAVPLDTGNQEDEHSCFSDTTHQDFVFNALGIHNVYRGNYKNFDGRGFDELLAKVAPNVNQRMLAVLGETDMAMGEINAPFDQVLASELGSPEREEVEQAIAALDLQAGLFQEVGAALGVEVEILAE